MKERLYGMDALRGIAMWLGVVLHTIIAYQTSPRAGWPSDERSHLLFDFFYHYIHAFRMPLFYLVAGFFANFLVEKIGERTFIKHRRNRILYPFLLCLITFIPLSSVPFHMNQLMSSYSGIDLWYQSFLAALSWTGFYHIWFLYYLLIFYGIMLLIRKIKFPIFNLLKIKNDFQFLATTVILIGVQFFFYDSQVEPYTGVIPKISQILYFGLFFSLGYVIYRYPKYLLDQTDLRWIYFGVGIALSVLLTFYPISNYFLFSILASLNTMFLVLGHIMIFMKFFKKESKKLRYFSDSSYWFYLIHYPIVVFLQIFLLQFDIPGGVKAISIIVFTTVLSLITYKYFVRNTWVGVLLNGRKMK